MAGPEDSAAYIPSTEDPVRVLLVEDSAVIRAFFRQFIEADPHMKVVATAGNGQRAIEVLKETQVDVIVLDIEMPIMDGLTALPHLLAIDPQLQVIVASTLTKENAVMSMKCLQAGAAECMAKPMSHELASSSIFKDTLLENVKTLGMVTRQKRAKAGRPNVFTAPPPSAVPAPLKPLAALASAAMPAPVPAAAPAPIPVIPSAAKKFTLRSELVKVVPDVIAIASSTGGPPALLQFFSDLKRPLKQPVLITQHMPPTFTTILAEHISKQSGLICREAVDGETVQGGIVYLAPGNYHMVVKTEAGRKRISLNQDPPENFCRPAADPMLRSLVEAYGRKVLAVIFTGMGSDGTKGARNVVDAGGTVLAQDEATSVVWGMPGSAAMAGLCTQVLPLAQIAAAVRDYADRIVSA